MIRARRRLDQRRPQVWVGWPTHTSTLAAPLGWLTWMIIGAWLAPGVITTAQPVVRRLMRSGWIWNSWPRQREPRPLGPASKRPSSVCSVLTHTGLVPAIVDPEQQQARGETEQRPWARSASASGAHAGQTPQDAQRRPRGRSDRGAPRRAHPRDRGQAGGRPRRPRRPPPSLARSTDRQRPARRDGDHHGTLRLSPAGRTESLSFRPRCSGPDTIPRLAPTSAQQLNGRTRPTAAATTSTLQPTRHTPDTNAAFATHTPD
jgi:hypothetical protein